MLSGLMLAICPRGVASHTTPANGHSIQPAPIVLSSLLFFYFCCFLSFERSPGLGRKGLLNIMWRTLCYTLHIVSRAKINSLRLLLVTLQSQGEPAKSAWETRHTAAQQGRPYPYLGSRSGVTIILVLCLLSFRPGWAIAGAK